jgi:cytoskeletal protein CcmA (bactofilin family)
MSLWKDNLNPKAAPAPAAEPQAVRAADAPRNDFVAAAPPLAAAPSPSTAAERARKESLIASDLTIEGKIEGAGSVRIAGRFKGDVNVQGDLTIENGAKLNGGVRAGKVTVAGELDGNIEAASRVELLESGAINGDLKAESLTVAAGSRIRGHVECGWPDKVSGKGIGRAENDAA